VLIVHLEVLNMVRLNQINYLIMFYL
jgi:hypothetical protein